MYQSTKTYDHNLGFSCAFRQWRATHSHCSLLHGYAMSFKLIFEAEHLDDCNWVVDFGGLDELKNSLRYWFDHTTVIAHDDPCRDHFIKLNEVGLIQLRGMPHVGCEAFAKHVYDLAVQCVARNLPHVRVVSAEAREHGANSAIYQPHLVRFGER